MPQSSTVTPTAGLLSPRTKRPSIRPSGGAALVGAGVACPASASAVLDASQSVAPHIHRHRMEGRYHAGVRPPDTSLWWRNPPSLPTLGLSFFDHRYRLGPVRVLF